MSKIIFALFAAGLAFGSGPCLVSCGPLLISYIAGTEKSSAKAIKIYLLFSLARIITYVALALLIFFLGEFILERLLNEYAGYLYTAGGIFIIALGLVMIIAGDSGNRLCRFFDKNMLKDSRKSVILLGLVIALLPCAPLLAIFSYLILVSRTWTESLFYSLSFGLGTLVSPLLLLCMLAGLIPKFFSGKGQLYARIFKVICGLVIVFLGMQLIWRVKSA